MVEKLLDTLQNAKENKALSIDVTSTTSIINGPVSNQNNNASIDSIYIITGVIIAIIVLGILTALVAVVLFMKARYALIMTFH